mmetsp:Transcript_6078/g.21458  ORF Transcript_6078/g.21458 Transcript_6078/m.21458 type:complete len:226 (-) Transcript_6078:363-1040(-)
MFSPPAAASEDHAAIAQPSLPRGYLRARQQAGHPAERSVRLYAPVFGDADPPSRRFSLLPPNIRMRQGHPPPILKLPSLLLFIAAQGVLPPHEVCCLPACRLRCLDVLGNQRLRLSGSLSPSQRHRLLGRPVQSARQGRVLLLLLLCLGCVGTDLSRYREASTLQLLEPRQQLSDLPSRHLGCSHRPLHPPLSHSPPSARAQARRLPHLRLHLAISRCSSAPRRR